MDIRPGSMITLQIERLPRSQAGRKTLIRLCRRDPQVQRRQRAQAARRPSERSWIRGGRYWHHQMRTRPPLALTPGSRYTIRATVDVLRDLASVRRWVQVTPLE